MRISDGSSDVCSSDLQHVLAEDQAEGGEDGVCRGGGRDGKAEQAKQNQSHGKHGRELAISLPGEKEVAGKVIGKGRRLGEWAGDAEQLAELLGADRKSTRLNSSH